MCSFVRHPVPSIERWPRWSRFFSPEDSKGGRGLGSPLCRISKIVCLCYEYTGYLLISLQLRLSYFKHFNMTIGVGIFSLTKWACFQNLYSNVLFWKMNWQVEPSGKNLTHFFKEWEIGVGLKKELPGKMDTLLHVTHSPVSLSF